LLLPFTFFFLSLLDIFAFNLHTVRDTEMAFYVLMCRKETAHSLTHSLTLLPSSNKVVNIDCGKPGQWACPKT